MQRRRWFLGMKLLLGGALTRYKKSILNKVRFVFVETMGDVTLLMSGSWY
jgi:hypothetical protein